jgi:ketosteroid isomerase-like protein
MSQIIIETFNADWLCAWSDKNIEALLGFYTPDTVYKDVQTAAGLHGRDALGAYLEQLFSSTPPMIYTADATWVISGGYCGRWYCEIGKDGKEGRLRGFDLVLFRDGLISHNEVYVHQLDVAT